MPAENEERDRLRKIKEQLVTLLERKAKEEKIHTEVLSTLSRADEQNRAHPDQAKRWGQVIDRLEGSLVEVKAKLTECDVLIEHEKRKLEEYLAAHDEGAQECDVEHAQAEELPEDKASGPEPEATPGVAELMAESADRELTAEEKHLSEMALELGKQYLAEMAKSAHNKRATAKRSLPVVQHGDSFTEQRKQLAMRHAIDKVKTGHIAGMTMPEVDLALSVFSLMVRQLATDPTNNRVLAIIGGTAQRTEELLQALRQKRAALYAKKSRS